MQRRAVHNLAAQPAEGLDLIAAALSPDGAPVIGLQITTAWVVLMRSLRSRAAYRVIKPNLMGALSIVSLTPGISQSDLARYLRISRMAASKQVAGCVRQGWIKRVQSTLTARRYELSLTARGRQALRRAVAIVPQHEKELTANLSPEETLQLNRLLRKLILG